MTVTVRSSTLRYSTRAVRKIFDSSGTTKDRLPPLPTIRDLLKLYDIRAMKHFSQNFLMDENLTHKIVKASGSVEDHCVCEVGPGPGGITRAILNRGAQRVLLIEKDTRFSKMLGMLEQYVPGRIETHYGDVLSFNMSQLFPDEERKDWNDEVPRIRIIGNLPFSVSTPLIIRWLKDISYRSNAWNYGRVTLTLTFQQEVAERLAAEAAFDQRCRLSIMAQYLCKVDHRFTIPGSAFVPKPDVNVGVVKFIPRKEPLINQPFELVEKVVRQTFHGRRRLCYHGIRTLFPEMIREEMADYMIQLAEIDRNTRSFQLTIEEFSKLCNAYAKICDKHPHIRDYNCRENRPDEKWEELHSEETDGILSEINEIRKDYEEPAVNIMEEVDPFAGIPR